MFVVERCTLYCIVLITVLRNTSLRETELLRSIGCEHESAGLCIIVLVFISLLYFVAQNIFACVIVLLSVVSIATRMLTPPQESPVVRGSAAQTADGYKSY